MKTVFIKKILILLSTVGLLHTAAGCGQKGPLFLPKPPVSKPRLPPKADEGAGANTPVNDTKPTPSTGTD
jgi:predicted small lipoprotein YifL